MRSILRLLTFLGLAALLPVLGSAPAAASIDMVVLHVEGAPYERGSVVDGSLLMRLEAGWTITLVASDGSYVTLTGPTEVVPAEANGSKNANPSILEALGALLAAEERSTAALGIVRSTGGGNAMATPLDAWSVNVSASGEGCIRQGTATLWRHDASTNTEVTIRPLGTIRKAKVYWSAGRETLVLNGASFKDGGNYVIEFDDTRAQITMHVMPAHLTGRVERAAWMAEIGCRAQAFAMLDTVR